MKGLNENFTPCLVVVNDEISKQDQNRFKY